MLDISLEQFFGEQINKNGDIAINKNKDKAVTIQAFYRSKGFQEVEAPRFVMNNQNSHPLNATQEVFHQSRTSQTKSIPSKVPVN
jgi:hypothetical protein